MSNASGKGQIFSHCVNLADEKAKMFHSFSLMIGKFNSKHIYIFSFAVFCSTIISFPVYQAHSSKIVQDIVMSGCVVILPRANSSDDDNILAHLP